MRDSSARASFELVEGSRELLPLTVLVAADIDDKATAFRAAALAPGQVSERTAQGRPRPRQR
jgi:hypothetical protein